MGHNQAIGHNANIEMDLWEKMIESRMNIFIKSKVPLVGEKRNQL